MNVFQQKNMKHYILEIGCCPWLRTYTVKNTAGGRWIKSWKKTIFKFPSQATKKLKFDQGWIEYLIQINDLGIID